VERIDPEPAEPFMTTAELLIVGALAAIAAAAFVCGGCEAWIDAIRQTIGSLFEGL